MHWYACHACVPEAVYEASKDTDRIVQCEFHIDDNVQPKMEPVTGRCLMSSGLTANWIYGGN